MRSYFDGLYRYFEFSGRSTRMQYWVFALFSLLLAIGAFLGDFYLFDVPLASGHWGPLTTFFALFHTIPGVTLTVRRLHDIGRSGWWYFIPLVPLVGSIVLFVWMCWPSEEGSNAYGDDLRDGDNYAARGRPLRTYSSIPRQVRMGSASRAPSVGRDSGSSSERFI